MTLKQLVNLSIILGSLFYFGCEKKEKINLDPYDSEVSTFQYSKGNERYWMLVYTDEFNKNKNKPEYIDSLVYEARERERKLLENIQKEGGCGGAQEMKRAVEDFKAKYNYKSK
jgi:hypothetical protein